MSDEERDDGSINLTSGVSLFTGEPFVQMVWVGETNSGQMTPEEMREFGTTCFRAAEAAETDAMLWQFVNDMGLPENVGARMLQDLRAMRDK